MRIIEPVKITLLDRERDLVLGMFSLMRAERLINRQRREDGLDPISIFRVIDEAMAGVRDINVSAQFVLVMLWACLSEEDPNLTLSDVSKMIDKPLRVTAKIFEVIKAYFATNDETEAGEADRPLAERHNGTISGPLPESN
jgi:hypothetical protein